MIVRKEDFCYENNFVREKDEVWYVWTLPEIFVYVIVCCTLAFIMGVIAAPAFEFLGISFYGFLKCLPLGDLK